MKNDEIMYSYFSFLQYTSDMQVHVAYINYKHYIEVEVKKGYI